MTMLFIDGFDHYAYNDLLKKWDTKSYATVLGTGCGGDILGPGRLGVGQYLGLEGITVHWFLPDEETSLVCGVGIYMYDTRTSISIGFNTQSGDNQCNCYIEATTGIIYARRGSTILGQSDPSVVTTGNWYYIQVKVTIHDTAGSMEIKLSDTTVVNVSGVDTKGGSESGCSTFTLGGSFVGLPWILARFDDVYLCNQSGSKNNDFLGDVGVYTLYPNDAGTYTQFTPVPNDFLGTVPNYENVDDVADIDEDETYNQSNVVGYIDTYNHENLGVVSKEIFCVAQNSCLKKQEAGLRRAKQVLISGVTTSKNTDFLVGDSYKVYQRLLENNPDDDAAWSDGDVAGIESGVEVV